MAAGSGAHTFTQQPPWKYIGRPDVLNPTPHLPKNQKTKILSFFNPISSNFRTILLLFAVQLPHQHTQPEEVHAR